MPPGVVDCFTLLRSSLNVDFVLLDDACERTGFFVCDVSAACVLFVSRFLSFDGG